jgi:hypothetical protein
VTPSRILTATVVSRAFQILSDSDKKAHYDKFGGDPDSRFGSGGAGPSSPFSGFARSPGRGPMFEDEISPEELFNRFFAGAGFGGPFGMSMYPLSTIETSSTNWCRWRLWRTAVCFQYGRWSWFHGTSDGWRNTTAKTSDWRRTCTDRNVSTDAASTFTSPLYPPASVIILQRLESIWTQRSLRFCCTTNDDASNHTKIQG